ncbi:MAG: hypothetical protein Q9183_001401 [Haloplaca sp. 2 TL-2023]
MALDRVPGDANLYIGGLFTLKRKEALKTANITHVLSVLTLPLDAALFEGYQQSIIDLDDDEDADIIQHFPASNAFIREALRGGGGVLVHCAMGKSRSATLIIAYLLSNQISQTPNEALLLLRQARPMAEPNPGFWSQLELYHRMHCPSDVISHPQYQRWCWEREKQRSAREGIPPGTEHIVFEDESASAHEKQVESGESGKEAIEEYRCRRCRTALGNSEYLVSHPPRYTNNNRLNPSSKTSNNEKSHQQQQQCAHLFLNPLSWMRPVLAEGHLEGRLECPNTKCKQNVGKYAWQGMKCSCGEWVVPGISVGRGKVDVVARR